MARGKAPDPGQTRAAVEAVAEWLRDPAAPAPPRAAVAAAVRMTARTLAHLAPGAAVEVRVPPFVAVQCLTGVSHTRGTPPNVLEASPRDWLRAATGLTALADEVAAGRIEASGTRAGEVAGWLPLVRLGAAPTGDPTAL